MSKMKLALDVVQDLRSLADSLEALADAALGEGPTAPAEPHPDTIPKHTTQSEPAAGASKPPTHTPSENPTTPPESAKELPKLTLVELRAFVAEKSTPENRPRIKAILEKYGVRKLTELPEDQYPALMREVEAL